MISLVLLAGIGAVIAAWRFRPGDLAVLLFPIGACRVVIVSVLSDRRTDALLLAAMLGAVAGVARRRLRAGMGASSSARASELRRLWVRLVDAVEISTWRSRKSARREVGAAGECTTADGLDSLQQEGWVVFHDLALPVSRANVDHLLIAPSGAVFLPGSKRWSSRYRVRAVGGRLFHGQRDVTHHLKGVPYEAAVVARHLGVPVTPLVLIDRAPVEGGELWHEGLLIIPAHRVCPVLRVLGQIPGSRPQVDVAQQAEHLLPPYPRKTPVTPVGADVRRAARLGTSA